MSCSDDGDALSGKLTASRRGAVTVVRHMRILHAIHSMSPETGGPAKAIRQLAQSARELGAYETEVVSLDPPGADFLRTGELAIHATGPGRGNYGYAPQLDRWLHDNLTRFDGVIVNGLWQYHAFAAWKACRRKVPYVVFTHGMLDPWFKHAYPLKHVKKALYWQVIEHRVLRDAAAVMFTASREAELARETFPRGAWESVVVPYGTLKPDGERELQIRRFYELCPRLQSRAFILFLGRLHEKKGCDLLIESFARAAAGGLESDLVLAGPDQQGNKGKLESQARSLGVGNRVHFPGMLGGAEKWGAFYAAEVFALPSHQENFGIAIAESVACGTPVLISDKVNIWREIIEEDVGFVDVDTAEGVFRLLERWRALPAAERRAMSSKCLSCFERRFNLGRTPEIVANVFQEELSRRARQTSTLSAGG